MIATVLFGAADRFCGSNLIERWGWRGRPIYYAAPVVLLFGGLAGLAWLAWRWPGWAPGKMDPETPAELLLTFLRHLPLALPVLWGHPLALLMPGIATGLGFLLGWYARRGRDVNLLVEVTRGAAFGFLAFL